MSLSDGECSRDRQLCDASSSFFYGVSVIQMQAVGMLLLCKTWLKWSVCVMEHLIISYNRGCSRKVKTSLRGLVRGSWYLDLFSGYATAVYHVRRSAFPLHESDIGLEDALLSVTFRVVALWYSGREFLDWSARRFGPGSHPNLFVLLLNRSENLSIPSPAPTHTIKAPNLYSHHFLPFWAHSYTYRATLYGQVGQSRLYEYGRGVYTKTNLPIDLRSDFLR